MAGPSHAHQDALSSPPPTLRVALIIERFAPGAGGAENVAWQTARELIELGVDLHVFARTGEPIRGASLRLLPAPRFWQPVRVLTFSERTKRATRGRFDLVYSMTRTTRQDIYRAGGGSHAHFLENHSDRAGRSLQALSPRHQTLLALERAVFRDPSQWIVCNSKMVARDLRSRHGIGSSRMFVLYNGVDGRAFKPRPANRQAERNRIDPDASAADSIWLFAGHGFQRKGLDLALHALALRPDSLARLWVAGRDSTARWRDLAARLGVASRVSFLGEREDMPELFAAADGLLLPTRYDAFANVCLEGASAGLPIITTRNNGASEIFPTLPQASLPPDDAEAIAHALDGLGDPVERTRVGEITRAVASRHDWRSHAMSLLDLFRRRLSETGVTPRAGS
ncbi:glycosyltransferase family 4 protein [Myxococcota bacterium]|nr:glycosyltransferase family 4 protein [Myxococcota bacterium]